MVQDKFKNPLNLSEQWKSETNLSQTMKFVPDFCHRLSIGQVHDKIHGPRQICLGFPEHWPWSKTNFSWISSALFLFASDFSMLIITKLSIQTAKKRGGYLEEILKSVC